MAVKKKSKKLTNKEKQFRKNFRKEMRKDGFLPPVKLKLNRKKFAQEVTEAFKSFGSYSDTVYLHEAIAWMISSVTVKSKVSLEQVGILKVMKIAMEIKKFMEEKKSNGEPTYTVGELFDKVVGPIVDL